MKAQLNHDFRLPLKSGGEFSSVESGFLVVENMGLPKKREGAEHLQLGQHIDFICAALKRCDGSCFWLVENPSDAASNRLATIFPVHNILNNSVAGYFEFDSELVKSFWLTFETIDRQEPWKNEEAWALATVTEKLPVPQRGSVFQKPYWSVDHLLQNCGMVNSLFVQAGWFAFLAIRPFEGAHETLTREFPEFAQPGRDR
jgi:hypothetical protein